LLRSTSATTNDRAGRAALRHDAPPAHSVAATRTDVAKIKSFCFVKTYYKNDLKTYQN
jgi:hypothetical protein